MNALMKEQLRLELDDAYKESVKRARNYIASIMKQSWFSPAQRQKMFTAEGGRQGLLARALCFIIEEDGDIDLGLNQFGAYVNHEYLNSTVSENRNIALSPNMDSIAINSPTLGQWAIQDLDRDVAERAGERLFGAYRPAPQAPISERVPTPNNPRVEEFLKDGEEKELFQLLADLGQTNHGGRPKNTGVQIRAAAKMLGWPKKKADKIVRRVRMRVERADQKD